MYKENSFKHPQFIHQLIEHLWSAHSITFKNDSTIFINEIDGSIDFLESFFAKYRTGNRAIKSFSFYYVAGDRWYIKLIKEDGAGERSKIYLGDILAHPVLAEIHQRISTLEILTEYC
jgi:hypothetical protein